MLHSDWPLKDNILNFDLGGHVSQLLQPSVFVFQGQ